MRCANQSLEPIKSSIITSVLDALADLDVSQKQISELSGVSVATIWRARRGASAGRGMHLSTLTSFLKGVLMTLGNRPFSRSVSPRARDAFERILDVGDAQQFNDSFLDDLALLMGGKSQPWMREHYGICAPAFLSLVSEACFAERVDPVFNAAFLSAKLAVLYHMKMSTDVDMGLAS